MAVTVKKSVVANSYTRLQADVTKDCWFQAPGKSALHVVLTDTGATAPVVDINDVAYVKPVVVTPGDVWYRADTVNNPAMQGEIWVRGDQDSDISWTE
ncbi:hypothetical protein SAMN03080615_01678 [Amphritea atlantica]|uniref:Uncharacterized protein n=1 Tax=Amphritea atlantica TaxID=355243 RepID=A0A1H9GH37_9GAMM|nr:hypothetical protein [Amphritea atlantica]SEQ49420.1 hypothetical protein SAMN03080615_01678 [Amphritea atlantica]